MKGLKAVVVESNAPVRESVVGALESREVKTVSAHNASDGLRAIERSVPHLVIIGSNLPGEVDGLGLCKVVRNQECSSDCVVVMIPGPEMERPLERCTAAGADLLVEGEFSPTELWAELGPLLEKRKVEL